MNKSILTNENSVKISSYRKVLCQKLFYRRMSYNISKQFDKLKREFNIENVGFKGETIDNVHICIQQNSYQPH